MNAQAQFTVTALLYAYKIEAILEPNRAFTSDARYGRKAH